MVPHLADEQLFLQRLGASVRRLRDDRGVSRAALAEAASLSPRFLAQLESGEGNISVLRLHRVAGALGVELAELLRVADDPEPRVIALLGLRGAGKTTVGRLLAEQLGVSFVELDELVEEAAGLSLAEIFDLQGGTSYRRLERRVLREFLDREQPAVLATGGGIVTDAETYQLLRDRSVTVWLRAEPADHWNRVVQQGDSRPMSGRSNAMSELEALWQQRAPLYARADHSVDTSRVEPAVLAARLGSVVGPQAPRPHP